MFSHKQKEWEVFPSSNQKEQKPKTTNKSIAYGIISVKIFSRKISNSKPNKPQIISNVIVFKQTTAFSLTYDIKVGITEPVPEVLGLYLFICFQQSS